MNRDDLETVRAMAEGTAAGLTKSFHEVVLNLAGPWSKEVGEEWREQWRQRRAEKIARRALEKLEQRGGNRRAIPLKVLLPALEQASLEDDGELREWWTELIANAATADATEITPAYGLVLRELTPRDAKLLEWIRDHQPEADPNDPSAVNDAEYAGPRLGDSPRVTRKTIVADFGLPDSEFELVCSRLERLGLCDVGRFVFPTRLGTSATGARDYDSIQLRPFGVALVDVCRRRPDNKL